MATTRRLASVAGILATLFCSHQFSQNAVQVRAFAPSVDLKNGNNYATVLEHGYHGCRNQQSPKSSSALSAAFQAENIPTRIATATEEDAAPAFLIERISQIPSNERLFHRISNMCIDVFFKELLLDDKEQQGGLDMDAGRTRKRDKLFPWKDWQIGYLKNLQAADLERRRRKFGPTNEMFLAYEVEATAPYGARSKPLLLDLDSVYNVNTLLKQQKALNNKDEACFVRGKLLGFVEITQRPYGIGKQNEKQPKEIFIDADGTRRDEYGVEVPEMDPRPLRPVLTNLAVRRDARKYGIGSKLLDACEQHVRKDWKLNEIILEVEDYNTRALEFYGKRGYNVLFSDPASRRYDVQGLWLRKVRCRRDVMRKVFHGRGRSKVESSAMDIFERIRQGWR